MTHPSPSSSRNYVLVHGLGLGGWCWARVARALRESGHNVFTPSLTGLAERSHLISPNIDLDTHITDVVNVLAWENLNDVFLVGHSYGGAVATGAADRSPHRVQRLVYLDAFILRDGESIMSLQPPERRQHYTEVAKQKGDGWKVPPNPAAFYGVTEPEDQRWIDELSVPQSLLTLEQPIHLHHEGKPDYQRSYVRASGWGPNVFDQFAERAREDPDWDYHEIAGGHMLMVCNPNEVTEFLLGLTHE